MRVLGLDLSTTSTGYAIFEDGVYVTSGVIQPASKNWQERTPVIVDQIDSMTFDIINIEDVYDGFSNPQTLIKLAVLQGMIREMARRRGAPVYAYSANAWRKKAGIQMKGKKRQELKQLAIDLVELKYDKYVCDDEAEAILLSSITRGRKYD